MGSSRQAVTVSRVDEREEHEAIEQELEEDEPPPPSDMGRLDAELRMQKAVSEKLNFNMKLSFIYQESGYYLS